MNHARRWTTAATVVAATMVLAACSSTSGGGGTTASQATTTTTLTVQTDTVYGSKNVPSDQAATQVCVNASRFPHNAEIVWRTRVVDPATGDDMDDQALEKVEVQLGDGQTLAMHYGGHPHDTPLDYFWTVSFDIPADYPTGTLSYQVVATAADGRTGSFTPFNVAPSLLTITEDTIPVIAAGD